MQKHSTCMPLSERRMNVGLKMGDLLIADTFSFRVMASIF